MKKLFISPSILSANFANLGKEVRDVIIAGGDMIHFDVMDNHYVNNLTFGPMVLQSLRKYGIKVPVDVHLMTKPVDNLIPQFAQSGANFISFHPETTNNINKTISLIKEYNCKAGVAINPNVPLNVLDNVIHKLDLILIMSVYPGFSGQKFIANTLNKINNLRNYLDRFYPNVLIAVDGGINLNNVINIYNSGANIFVIGSTIFNSDNYLKTICEIKSKLNI